MAYRVFISCANEDIPARNKIARKLKQNDIEPLFYKPKEAAGHYPARKIKNYIKQCDLVIVILTPNGIQSAWVNQEIGFAEGWFDKEEEDKIISFVQNGVKLVGFAEAKHDIRFSPWNNAKKGLTELVRAVKHRKKEYYENIKEMQENEEIRPRLVETEAKKIDG